MTDKEYNDETAQIISIVQLRASVARAGDALKEFREEWDELLEDRELKKRTYENLFSRLTNKTFPLAAKNTMAIIKLKKTSYPLLLCGLAKCYLEKGRLQDAETVLLEAKSLGSKGAEVLLFFLYTQIKDGGREANIRLADSFEQVKSIDILSETVTEEIDNELYQCNALIRLSQFYRLIDNDTDKSYQILVRALNADWPDYFKEHIAKLLSHFHKTPWGGYEYVD